jgi:CarD family transcriptional regulator
MSKSRKSQDFSPNEYVVYPAHGVGQIVSIEEAGNRWPQAGAVRDLVREGQDDPACSHREGDRSRHAFAQSSPDIVSKAMDTLKGKAKVKRAMWSRRAQEYEQKINSGDLISIAEVVRDLHRADDQREQSYSERQLYEAALERLTRELAAVKGMDEAGAQKQVDEVLMARAA